LVFRQHYCLGADARHFGNCGGSMNSAQKPAKAPPPQINRLTLPVYVPPKTLHRPVISAPGCVVRRYLTSEVMG
jgi:hypothetical protein